MSRDPLSDVLRLTEASIVATGGFSASGRWALRFPAPGQIVLSVIARGQCWLRIGERTTRLEEGDVGLLPGAEGFVMSSALDVTPVDVVLSDMRGRIEPLTGESDCVVLSGRVSLQPSSGALLTGVLPSQVLLRASAPGAEGIRQLVEILLAEQRAHRPGASVASDKLAELVFIQILRAHAESGAASDVGWLRAIGDVRIGRALCRIHDTPARAWTLEELAKAAGMSRTRFAVQFKALAGVTPLDYLARWRMQLARRALGGEDVSVAHLARALGYGSESAFSTAFKRTVGVAPSAYREQQRATGTAQPRLERARTSSGR